MTHDLFQHDERESSEYMLPDDLSESVVLAVGNATFSTDETALWIVAATEDEVLLYGCSQRNGLLRAWAWKQPTSDPVVSAQVFAGDFGSKAAEVKAARAAAEAEKNKKVEGEKEEKKAYMAADAPPQAKHHLSPP